MVPSRLMPVQSEQEAQIRIVCIAGPTASGKSTRAVNEALARGGEIISVDSRQVYRGLDIGTEKITPSEMLGVPHHLIDIRDVKDTYSAGDFVRDVTLVIREIVARGKVPILVGGTHFYFDALLNGLPAVVDANPTLREELEKLSDEELYSNIARLDPRRALELDPHNRRRLIRALEIIAEKGSVPERIKNPSLYNAEWILLNPSRELLRQRLDDREATKFPRGLIREVRRVQEEVGDERLNELGLEYKIVGEYLRGERNEESLLPTLSAKLWQYARRQKAWLRKLQDNNTIVEEASRQDKS
jgi:tRNA dimethylallyltransferase